MARLATLTLGMHLTVSTDVLPSRADSTTRSIAKEASLAATRDVLRTTIGGAVCHLVAICWAFLALSTVGPIAEKARIASALSVLGRGAAGLHSSIQVALTASSARSRTWNETGSIIL